MLFFRSAHMLKRKNFFESEINTGIRGVYPKCEKLQKLIGLAKTGLPFRTAPFIWCYIRKYKLGLSKNPCIAVILDSSEDVLQNVDSYKQKTPLLKKG